jgi:FAD/FMN-containing dehydrogenase
MLPRGGGTSQCGQTTGAALVIDNSKHLRRIHAVDPQAMTAEVEPGLVLDHLNAQLKPHGLWFPVDVSTSAQATLGGMAGNNSCGSRSIAYGNMVHNVRGLDAWLADGTAVLRPGRCPGVRERGIADFVRGLADPTAARDRGALAQGDAARGRLQPGHLPSRKASAPTPPTAASTWRTCWSAAKARWP